MLGFAEGKEQKTTGRRLFGNDELIRVELGARCGECYRGFHLLCSLAFLPILPDALILHHSLYFRGPEVCVEEWTRDV